MEALKRDVDQDPEAYPYERAKRLGVSQRGIGYALNRLGIRRKKRSHIQKRMSRHVSVLKSESRRIRVLSSKLFILMKVVSPTICPVNRVMPR